MKRSIRDVKPLNYFWAFLLIYSCLTQTLFATLKWAPVVKVDLLGGQLFFEGQNTSFSGNGNWLVAPGIQLNDHLSIIPTASGKYRRMREVQELVGGGFLTQETFENAFALKTIYKMTPYWKVKLKSSFKNQLLVESSDETLGKGLYDNNKLSLGLELERGGSFFKSLRFSFDPYGIRFIRYKSLSSGSSLGSEIKSGENTLDFNAYDETLGGVVLLDRLILSGSTLISYRVYTDQKTVTSSGQYTDQLRSDVYSLTTLESSYKLPTFDNNTIELESVAGLDLNYTLQNSNQHNYDASHTKFNEKYYDYGQFSVTPHISTRLNRKLEINLSYGFTGRNYSNRPIQAQDGSYKLGLLYQNYHTLIYSFKYPISFGLSAVAQGVYRKSTSNMEYEKTYKYNYSSQHYYLGMSWEY